MTNNKHLVTGPISPDFISAEIASFQSGGSAGAQSIFLGRVRADNTGSAQTTGIEYSAYEEMAAKVISDIRTELFNRFDDLISMEIWHSTGMVSVGEISLFVLVSSGHRKQAFAATEACVELIKEKLPVWKKEIFSDGSHEWKGA